MLNYIKRILYTSGLWSPKVLNSKVSVLLGTPNLNVYKCNQAMILLTDDIAIAINLLKHIITIDYYSEYAVKIGANINRTKITYMYRWYNHNGIHIDNTDFIIWLNLIKEVNILYKSGLVFEPEHRAHRNSIKIKPLLDEAEVIITAVLKCY